MFINSPADVALPPGDRCVITRSRLSPWLAPLMYALGGKIILPAYFRRIDVTGAENIPRTGPVVLAPTHQARWDSLLVGLMGMRMNRYLRFMVTADECLGLQGWLIRRLGGFPVHVRKPSVKSLRHGVQLLQDGEMLVIYPEGDIFRDGIHPLKPGLARIALRAEASRSQLGMNKSSVKIVPISLTYSDPCPKWRGSVKINIGQPISVADYRQGSCKEASKRITADLQSTLHRLAAESEALTDEKDCGGQTALQRAD